jgi:hypothetical protein
MPCCDSLTPMKTTSIAILLLLTSIGLRAQVIVSYELTGGDFQPTTLAGGVTATPLNNTGSNLVNFVAFDNAVAANPAFPPLVNTPALAVSNAQFFQFTVTPPPGAKLNLAGLVFQARREQAQMVGWVVRSSVDGFSTNLGTSDIPSVLPTFTPFGISLPASAFSGITSEVTFRIYTYQSDVVLFADYDNIQLLGVTDAPPVVSVFSNKRVTTAKARLKLTGVAFDDIGVQQVTVNSKVAAGTTSWRATVRLKPGRNKIRILATDVNGAVSRPVTIRVKRIGGTS